MPQGKAEELQEQILRLQLAKLQREEDVRHQEEQIAVSARRIGAEALQHQREEELIRQTACKHFKPNSTPAIGGQWDHRGHVHWICAYCAKEWTDNELPLELRIDMSRVGGPTHA